MDEDFLSMTIAAEFADWRSYKISPVAADSTKVEITNEKTKSKASFDLIHHTCAFDNYDAFFQDSVIYWDSAKPQMDYIRFADYPAPYVSYSNIPGQTIMLDWSTQDIGVVLANVEGKYYLSMPLQSFSDIFNCSLVYNGSKLFTSSVLINGYGSQIVDDYYSTSTI